MENTNTVQNVPPGQISNTEALAMYNNSAAPSKLTGIDNFDAAFENKINNFAKQ